MLNVAYKPKQMQDGMVMVMVKKAAKLLELQEAIQAEGIIWGHMCRIMWHVVPDASRGRFQTQVVPLLGVMWILELMRQTITSWSRKSTLQKRS